MKDINTHRFANLQPENFFSYKIENNDELLEKRMESAKVLLLFIQTNTKYIFWSIYVKKWQKEYSKRDKDAIE